MIYVRTPKDVLFNYAECEELYNECKKDIRDDNFEDVIKRTLFYAFYIRETNELLGCIYYYLNGRKLMVNVFAGRKHHLLNLECFKESLKWFKRNVYAIVLHKTSKLCVLRLGFEHVKGNLYVYRKYRRKKNG